MKRNRKGFTLLELLIVVIIVGVLATLAVPRYFRAVERARWAEAISNLGVLRGSQIRYKARHGNYATAIDHLDADISPTTRFFTFVALNENEAGGIDVARATRNATQNTPGVPVNLTLTIEEDGDFIYGTGFPAWLQ